MAVYGVGAYYNCDVSQDFIKQQCFCIGHGKSDATTLYEMLRRAKIGDIVYIKSFSPSTPDVLHIKAIGFIIGRNIGEYYFPESDDSMGFGRKVRWVKNYSQERKDWKSIELKDEDKVNNVYSNTMYEEYSAEIIKEILDYLLY